MIKDHFGTVTFEALCSTELKGRMETLKEDYVAAYKAWKAADDKSEPKPKKPGLRILQRKIKGKESKAKAESLAARCQEKYEERLSKKREKEERANGKPEKTRETEENEAKDEKKI